MGRDDDILRRLNLGSAEPSCARGLTEGSRMPRRTPVRKTSATLRTGAGIVKSDTPGPRLRRRCPMSAAGSGRQSFPWLGTAIDGSLGEVVRQTAKALNHGRRSRKSNWDCTICHSCHAAISDLTGAQKPEIRSQLAGLPSMVQCLWGDCIARRRAKSAFSRER